MAITTLAEVKSWLGIATLTTTWDDKIEALIPAVEADYLRIRNAPFDLDDDDAVEYPIGSDLTAAEMIGFRLSKPTFGNSAFGKVISSESIDNYSVSFDNKSTIDGYPKDIVTQIDRFVRGD